MKSIYLAAVLISALLAGCGGKKQSAAPDNGAPRSSAPVGEETIVAGKVSQVDDRGGIASVTDIDTSKFKEGDILVFLDPNQAPIADGKVTAIVSGGLHVRYNLIDGGRAPREGDIAVRFTR